MVDSQSSSATKKIGSNPLIFIGAGCLIIVVLLGIISSIAFKFFAKKIGVGVLQKVIENKTGIKTSLQDIENGKMSFTDKKTGTKIDIGSNKIPASFPDDFPLYPGMKLVSSLSGAGQANGSGFWLTFSTADSFETVDSYYVSALTKNGWKETSNYSAGGTSTKTVEKGTYNGSISITRGENAKETEILIMLGEDAKSSGSSNSTSDTP